MGIRTTPNIYLSGYISDFTDKEAQYGLSRRTIKKGELLTVPGIINNTSHYIHQGMMRLSLMHSSGNVKALSLYGPNTVFPLGVKPHNSPFDFEMELCALTDLEVTSFTYEMLRQMCVDDGTFAAEILEENCDFIGYMFHQTMNAAYTSASESVCDMLYLYLLNVDPQNQIIAFSQGDLASLVGISRVQVERILKQLREEGIILTQRGQMRVLSIRELFAHCSHDIQEFNPLPVRA